MFDNGSFYHLYLALDKNESSLMVLMKYHDQLVKISGKIPFTEADCAVKFTWKDPFTSNKGFMSSGSRLEFMIGADDSSIVLVKQRSNYVPVTLSLCVFDGMLQQ